MLAATPNLSSESLSYAQLSFFFFNLKRTVVLSLMIPSLTTPLTPRASLQSPDGTCIYLCCGAVVHAFCTNAGAPTGRMFLGHSANVTGVACHSSRTGHPLLLTGSLDETLRSWSALDGTLIKLISAPGPIQSMAVPAPAGAIHFSQDVIFLSCWLRTVGANQANGGRVYAFSLSKSRTLSRLSKSETPQDIVINPLGTFLGAFERHSVTIWSLRTEECGAVSFSCVLRHHHSKPVTALAFSHDNNIVAAGDITGRIILWDGLSASQPVPESVSTRDDVVDHVVRVVQERRSAACEQISMKRQKSLLCSTLHWHAQPVRCLCFTADGSYLLSGGMESVLVFWQLDGYHRSYLPRLSAPINYILPISGTDARIAIAGDDNAVRIVSLVTRSVVCSIHGVRPATFMPHRFRRHPIPQSVFPSTTDQHTCARGIVTKYSSSYGLYSDISIGYHLRPAISFDPGTYTVAFAALDAGIQLYNFQGLCQHAELDVDSHSSVTAYEQNEEHAESYVSHAVFSTDGSILITVSRRADTSCQKHGVHTNRSGVDDSHFPCTALALDLVADSTSKAKETLRVWERPKFPSSNNIHDVSMSNRNSDFSCVFVSNSPHEKPITAVALYGTLGSSTLMACTVSFDGNLKIWSPLRVSLTHLSQMHWICRSEANHQGLPPPILTSTAFSQDGTILATAGSTIKLWDTDACVQLNTLSLSCLAGQLHEKITSGSTSQSFLQGPQPIKALAFLVGQPLLISVSCARAVVWNILNLTVWRAIMMPCTSVTAHGSLSTFSVVVIPTYPDFTTSSDCMGSRDQSNAAVGDIRERPVRGLVVQFSGPLAISSRCWSIIDGAPENVFYPVGGNDGHIVVTCDRSIITAECSRSYAVVRGYSTDTSPNPEVQTKIPHNVDLNQKDVTNPQDSTTTVGFNFYGAPCALLNDLSDIASHRLPRLSLIAPSFLDTTIAHIAS